MSDVELTVSANVDAAMKEVAGFRKEYADLVKQVEKPLRQVNSFRELETTLEQTGRKMAEARERVRALGTAMASVEQPTKQMTADYRQAVNELKRLERQEQAQIGKLGAMRRELQASGVDTRNLAAEQRRLAQELSAGLSAGRADASMSAAKDALGVGAIEETQRGLVELRRQYQLVTSDGTLSGKQRAEAEAAYRRNVAATLAKLRELRQANAQQASSAERAATAEAARFAQAREGIRRVAAEQKRAAIEARGAAVEAARNDLGVSQARAAEAAIGRLQRQYQLLKSTGGLTKRELALAQETLNSKIREARRELSGLNNDQLQIAYSAKVAGGLIAAAMAGGAFAGWIKGASDAAAEMGRLARVANSTSEVFSAWTYAAKSVGVGQDQLGDILKDTQDKIGDFIATGGGELKDFFENVAPLAGVTAEQFRNLSGPDALQLYVSTLERANLSNAEMTFYLEAIANDSTKLLPLLENNAAGLKKLTAEAEEFGVVVSSQTSAEAKEFNAQLQKLGAATSSVGQQVTAEMLPAMTDMTGLMADFAKDSEAASTAAGVISTAMKILATVTIMGATAFANLGRTIGGTAASAYAALRGDFSQAADIMRQIGADTERAARDAAIRVGKLWDGTYATQAATKAAEGQRTVLSETEQSMVNHVKQMKGLQEQAVKNAEAALKKQVSAEKEAANELEQAKKTQLETQKRYAEALAGLQGAGGEASYAAAQALKAKAAQALAAGDVEGVKLNAQAALEMLQELADEGENTFGFEGFIKSLRRIEEAADQINVDKAKKALDEVKQKGVDLKKLLDSVKTTTITVKMDDAALAKVRQDIVNLSSLAGKPVELPAPVAWPAGGRVAPAAASANVSVSIPPAAADQATKQAAELASRMEEQLKVEPTVEPPKMYRDGNSFTQFPPVAVTPELDQAAAAAAQQQVAGLAQSLQQQLVVPITPVLSGGGAPAYYRDGNSFSQFPQPDGYASGGYITGPGTGTSDSILARLSNGEYVLRADAVRHYGKALLDQINSRRFPGFATGGLVTSRLSPPSIPAGMAGAVQAAAAPQAPSFPFLGEVKLEIGGHSGTVYATEDFAQTLRRTAMKFGRTHRR